MSAGSTMVDNLLRSAEDLIRLKPNSAAYYRRAVSHADYSVFHALAKLCARTLLSSMTSTSDDEYLRIYRALDHRDLKSAFGQSPLRDHPTISLFGNYVVSLQIERHRADYLPPDPSLYSVERVREPIGQAQFVIDMI